MKKRVLSLLGLMGLIVAGSFVWHRQHAPAVVATDQSAAFQAAAASTMPAALALEKESIDALQADNTDLQARVSALRSQQADADQLIALKTARLATLEKPAQKP